MRLLVSESNLQKVDKPSQNDNEELKVPSDKDYSRESDQKDQSVITYIPQYNGGIEELYFSLSAVENDNLLLVRSSK